MKVIWKKIINESMRIAGKKVTTEKVIVEENSSQENILNIEDIFSDPSIPLNEILRNPKLLESDPTNNGYR